MLAGLSRFFATWDPDCERPAAFANLNQFARDHQEAIAPLNRLIGADCRNFGMTFYRHLTRKLLGRKTAEVRAFIEALGPLLAGPGALPDQQFWGALSADANVMSRMRQRDGRLRSCWGVTPIVNMRSGVEADRLLGVEAESLVFTDYHITSNFDFNFKEVEAALIAERYDLIHPFRRLVLAWALLRYDVFHLYNDAGIIALIGGYGARMGIALDEMHSYRISGKRLYTYTYGADHRMRRKASAAGRWTFCSECPEPGKFCVCDDAGGERMLATIREHATAMIAHGLSHPQVPGSRNIASTAMDLADVGPARGARSHSGPLRVGHFPNHPYFKGTKHLEAAVERLKADGVEIELLLITGIPRTQVLETMRDLDVLVDQLISGAFGLTAIEGMALGLPVICYLHDQVAVADLANCPIIEANPETIEAVLRRLAADRAELLAAAAKGRDYVAKNYSVPALAKHLATLYRDTAAFSPHLIGLIEKRAALAVPEVPARRLLPTPPVFGRFWRLRYMARAIMRISRSVLAAKTTALRGKLRVTMRALEAPIFSAISDMNRNAWKLPFMARAVMRISGSVLRAQATVLMGKLRAATRVVKEPTLRLAGWALARSAEILISSAVRLRARRLASGRVRTLWGTTPILTLPILSRCDKLLGLGSDALVFTTYYITKNFSIDLTIPDKIAARATRIRRTAHRRFRFAVLAFVMMRYDAVHFFYDRGILPGTERFGIEEAEIDLLHSAGVKIYTYAYGADVRTHESTLALGPVNFCTDCPKPGAYCICDQAQLDLSLSRLDRRVTARIAMGDMLTYVPGCRNMHYWPLDLDHLQTTPLSWKKGETLRIAHAPNHSHFKGTHHLESAIGRLRDEGYDVEMVKISGVPNTAVLDMFRSVSLVADQFIGGFHGYTALEAMALGRPVLCFLRAPDMTIAPDEAPIINTPPHLVYEVLKSILDGEIDLPDLGRRSRRFIERHYSIPAVAARLGRLYLETSAWPKPVFDRISQRVTELEAGLPAPMFAPPPIPWERVYAIPPVTTIAVEPARSTA